MERRNGKQTCNLPPNQCHIPQLDSLCLILDSSHQLFVAMLMNWSIKYTCALCSTKTSQLLIHPRTKVDMASSPYSFSSTVSIFLFLLLALLTVSATRAEVAAAAAPVVSYMQDRHRRRQSILRHQLLPGGSQLRQRVLSEARHHRRQPPNRQRHQHINTDW